MSEAGAGRAGDGHSKRTSILRGLTLLSTPTSPAQPLQSGSTPLPRYPWGQAGARYNQTPQMQSRHQQLRSITRKPGACRVSVSRKSSGGPQRQPDSSRSEATTAAQSENRFPPLRLGSKRKLQQAQDGDYHDHRAKYKQSRH